MQVVTNPLRLCSLYLL